MGNRCWSEEDINYLLEKWGVANIRYIAKKLNRTVTAVQIKRQKLNLANGLDSSGLMTIGQLAEAIGISLNSVRDTWIKKHKLSTKKKVFSKEKKITVIDLDDFWKWAKNHKQVLNFAHFEKNMLGEEPSWVDIKRNADRKNPGKFHHNKVWTKKEDTMLINMLKTYRYTYQDLSKELNRTEAAIRRRIMDLDLIERPLRSRIRLWKEDETQKLIKLYNDGYGFDLIGAEIGRTGEQVRSKVERLGKEGIL